MGSDEKQVLGDVMDSFILEAARGGMRLAKHRKAEKVEVKDVAFFLGRSMISASAASGSEGGWRS